MRVVRFARTAELLREAGVEIDLGAGIGAAAGADAAAAIAPADPSPTAEPSAPQWMTVAEARRFKRLRRADDRAAYAAAHLLVRVCAGEMLGVDPTELTIVQRCAGCGRADHGRPTVLGHELHVSLSHARGRVAAMASEHPCGIDVEEAPGTVARRALSPAEWRWIEGHPDRPLAFARLWTRKEALVKAGVGSLERIAGVDALRPGQGVRLWEWGDGRARGAWCERR